PPIADTVLRKRMYVYTRSCTFSGYRTVVEPSGPRFPEHARYVHPGTRRTELQHRIENLRLLQESPPPFVVARTDRTQMTRQVTPVYERCKHRRDEGDGVSVGHVFCVDKRANELLGNDGVRYPKPGEQYLVEATDIDDTTVRVGAL